MFDASTLPPPENMPRSAKHAQRAMRATCAF